MVWIGIGWDAGGEGSAEATDSGIGRGQVRVDFGHMKLKVILIAALATATAGRIFSEEAETLRLPLPDDALEEDVQFYSAYMKGTKIGWMSEATAKKKRAGREVISVRVETHTVARAFGAEVRSVEVEESWFETVAPHRFIGGRKTSTSGGLVQHIEVVPPEDGKVGGPFKVTVKEAGETKEREWDPGDFRLSDATTATAWFRRGPEEGDSVRVRAVSIGGLEATVDTLTVLRAPGSKNGEKTYLAKVANSERGEVGTAEVTTDGEIVEMRIGGGAFVIRREEAALARVVEASDVDMFVDNIVRVDQKLGHPGEITEMVLKITGEEVEKIPSCPNQKAEYDADTKVLTLSVGKRYGERSPAGEKEVEKALQDTVLYPSKDPEVVALARRAVRGAGKGKAAQVAALVKFVDTFIADEPTAEPMTVADIMERRKGDCTEHALLFVTLARALEIPSREISGLFYADEIGGFGGHAWAEVALDGEWVPVDPAWNQTWTDAAHIRIYTDGASDYAQQTVQLSGDMKIEVVEVKRKK